MTCLLQEHDALLKAVNRNLTPEFDPPFGAHFLHPELDVLLDPLREALVPGEGGPEFGHPCGRPMAGNIPALFV